MQLVNEVTGVEKRLPCHSPDALFHLLNIFQFWALEKFIRSVSLWSLEHLNDRLLKGAFRTNNLRLSLPFLPEYANIRRDAVDLVAVQLFLVSHPEPFHQIISPSIKNRLDHLQKYIDISDNEVMNEIYISPKINLKFQQAETY